MNLRHKFSLALLVFLIFSSFVAREDYWITWTTIAVLWGMLFIVDLMFLDMDSFKYEPNYKSWQKAQEPKY